MTMVDNKKDDEMSLEQLIQIELDGIILVQAEIQRCELNGRDTAQFERLYDILRKRYFNLLAKAQ